MLVIFVRLQLVYLNEGLPRWELEDIVEGYYDAAKVLGLGKGVRRETREFEVCRGSC